MSRIIRSNRVNLSEGAYKLSSDVFISKERYAGRRETHDRHESFSREQKQAKKAPESEEEYGPNYLIEKAEKAALEIMDNAQAVADRLIADARSSARALENEAMQNTGAMYESAKKKGHEEGFEAGFDEGYAEGARQAEELIEQANLELEDALEIKRQLHIKRKEFYIQNEAEIINLVLAISKKVIGREISDGNYIESLIEGAMSQLNYATEIVLRVSEHDFDSATLAKPKILAMAERIENLEIKVDYALPQGSCIIDTDTGSIDSSIKTQLEGIEALFNNILMAKDPEGEQGFGTDDSDELLPAADDADTDAGFADYEEEEGDERGTGYEGLENRYDESDFDIDKNFSLDSGLRRQMASQMYGFEEGYAELAEEELAPEPEQDAPEDYQDEDLERDIDAYIEGLRDEGEERDYPEIEDVDGLDG